MGKVCTEEITYKAYGRALRIYNEQVEVVVTLDKGPRIIRYGFIGEENQFGEEVPVSKKIGEQEWQLMGGHRLWHSPEHPTRTYQADCEKVCYSLIENGVKVTQQVEPWTQIKKEMEITLALNCSEVKVIHRLINKNAWPIECAAWAISVMAKGGMEIIPQDNKETELLANRIIALWPYAKMNDSRVKWGEKYILLQQDPNIEQAFKMGINNEKGWVAYLRKGTMFVKKYEHVEGAKYPDFGVSYETYLNHLILELETLSPLKLVEPDQSIEHIECWKLWKNINLESLEEKTIEKLVQRNIE